MNDGYPDLPPVEAEWRPQTASDILLRDRDLAKLGFLAQAEALAKSNLTCAIKGAERLSTEAWRQLEPQQFKQLADRLYRRASDVDDELRVLTEQVQQEHETALKYRHQNLHSLWGWNSSIRAPMALDMKRNEKLGIAALDAALSQVASLTFTTKACLFRVGRLIADGVLLAADDQGGPSICLEAGQWVKL